MMNLTIPPAARTAIYVVAFAVAVITAAVLIVLVAVGAADLATIKDIALWIFGIFGVGGHGVALLNRPTKETTTQGDDL